MGVMKKGYRFFTALLGCSVLLAVGCKKTEKTVVDEDPAPMPPKEYQLVWSDEFEGTKLDMTKWSYNTGTGFGNQEKQYCTDKEKNVKIEGGNLIITAFKESYLGCNYTSGRISSKGKGFVKYGKVEARISLPSGKGTWPAFWMLPEIGGWPKFGEIDIMEHVGSDPTMISHALHTQNKNGSKGNNWHSRVYPGGVEGEFNVYTMEWLENFDDGDDCIIFSVNGKETGRAYQSLDNVDDWPFNREFYVILNLAIGGSWGGFIDDSIFDNPSRPVEMKVDYVRLYQKK